MNDAPVTSMSEAKAETMPVRSTPPDRLHVTCYENEVPSFVEAELTQLYGNIYSSLLQLEIDGTLNAATSTYVAYKGGKITSVFLFQRNKHEARVLNEGMRIDADELRHFVNYIFSSYSAVDMITFHAVQPDTSQLSLPYQRHNCLEDIVLSLPENRVAYLDSLGNSTRNYIKRYLNKLKRSFPSFSHRIYIGHEIEEQHVRDIVRLNSARMEEKGKTPGIDQNDIQRIVQLVRECGLVSVMFVDDRICAGTINYQVGDNYFLEVIAHDPAYNEYRLGTLCCYLTICECIARDGSEYHFLWGKNEYKYRLLGIERELDHLTIYRSQRHILLHLDSTLKNIGNKYRRKAQLWWHEAQHHDDTKSRFAVNALRAIRHFRSIHS